MISPQEFTHKKTAQYTIRGTFICSAEAARIEYGFLRLAAASPPEPRPITSYNYEAISQMQQKAIFHIGGITLFTIPVSQPYSPGGWHCSA